MITEDEVMRLFAQADPASIDAVVDVDTGLLDAIRTRSTEMTITETIIDIPKSTPNHRRNRWLVVVAAAAAVALIVGIVAALSRDESAGPASSADAEALAMEFVDAFGALDANRALPYLGAVAAQSLARDSGTLAAEWTWRRAMDWESTPLGCEQVPDTNPGARLRCGYEFHALHSEEMGLGPFKDNYFVLRVDQGFIVEAEEVIGFETNGFSTEVWEPMHAWVQANHPEDFDAMYGDEPLTAGKTALWRQLSREYANAVKTSGTTLAPLP